MTKKAKKPKFEVIYRGLNNDVINLLKQPNAVGAIAIILNPDLPPRFVLGNGTIEEVSP